MENLIFCLNATIPIFLVMVIGYGCKNLKLMDESFVKTLNAFNYKVTLPVLLFKDISEADFYAVWDTRYVLFCFLVTLLCICVLWVLATILCREKTIIGEVIQASYRSSAAVLGIALIQNIYGTS
ncbi:MAG: AEC family transporter, partial [Lachnospiraceae bacterium]|nr:AEC family transporter [Lachnospiraceae bacterium]